jgi:hypothetical protein
MAMASAVVGMLEEAAAFIAAFKATGSAGGRTVG